MCYQMLRLHDPRIMLVLDFEFVLQGLDTMLYLRKNDKTMDDKYHLVALTSSKFILTRW